MSDLVFERDPKNPKLAKYLDPDGLPYPGRRLVQGDIFYCFRYFHGKSIIFAFFYFTEKNQIKTFLYCFRNDNEAKYEVKKYEYAEIAYVDNIKLCGNDTGSGVLNR